MVIRREYFLGQTKEIKCTIIYKRKKERKEKKTDHVNGTQMKLYMLYKDRYKTSRQWFVNLFGARSKHVSATYFICV